MMGAPAIERPPPQQTRPGQPGRPVCSAADSQHMTFSDSAEDARTGTPGEGLESRFSRQVREHVMREIHRRGLDDQELAEVLDLFPAGVRRLQRNQTWEVSTGLRAADALGLDMDVSLRGPQDKQPGSL